MSKLTHLDDNGSANMVDVGDKPITTRIARACAEITMLPATLQLAAGGAHKKGDVLTLARVAGIQAAKQCSNLIPLCHPLMLSKVDVSFELDSNNNRIKIESLCKLSAQTGVEMEALCAVSVAALTIFDMCKAVDKTMQINAIRVIEKRGGRSGDWAVDNDD